VQRRYTGWKEAKCTDLAVVTGESEGWFEDDQLIPGGEWSWSWSGERRMKTQDFAWQPRAWQFCLPLTVE